MTLFSSLLEYLSFPHSLLRNLINEVLFSSFERKSFKMVTFVAGPLSTQLLTSDESLLSLSLFLIVILIYVSVIK